MRTAIAGAARQRRSSGEAVPEAKITRLNEKIATLREEIQRLNALNTLMMQTEDKQISENNNRVTLLLSGPELE